MKTKTFVLTTTGILLTSVFFYAQAEPAKAPFTSHHLVDEKPYQDYAENMSGKEKISLRQYLEYDDREPCQNYQRPPQGFFRYGCELNHEAQLPRMVSLPEPEPKPDRRPEIRPGPLTDYEVLFEFDQAEIEPEAAEALDQIAREIQQLNPRRVAVAGFTDTAGPAEYNARLSEARAQAVSNALTERGVENQILNKAAYGENRLAVETPDGMPLRENRRVVMVYRPQNEQAQ